MAEKVRQLTNANQTDKVSLFAALNSMMQRGKLDTDGMIPATVVSYDRKNNVAIIKPVIQWMGLDDMPRSRNELTEISVLSLGGGGFHISFPIKEGDLGWIFAADRDLSNFKKELQESPPPTGRTKSFGDGLFIPDVFRQYTVQSEDSGAMVIQSTDGATRISVRGNNIKITAPSKVTIDTPMVEMTQQLTVQGMATFNGGIKATGTATLPAGTTIGDIDVSTHGHEQNGDSGRTSGGMEA